ncbi:MAG: hypothetical protein WD119_01950 [Pirellulaceae bacterium]
MLPRKVFVPALASILLSMLVAPPVVLAQPAGQEPPDVRTETTRFAPGTVRVIPPQPTAEETFTGPLTLRGLLDQHPEIQWEAPDFEEGRPHFDPRTRTLAQMAQNVILRREVFCFEFAFKPLRQIYVDVPQPNGTMRRKLIWYMVYRVRYRGGDLRPATDGDERNPVYSRIESVGYESRHFFPMFALADQTTEKEYLDRIIPAVKSQIKTREKITAELYNSVEISSIPIPRTSDAAAPGVWGLATWEDIDPNIDFFSVFVYRLTNAVRRVETEDGDEKYQQKVLQLNFYRPGDTVRETEDVTRFGIPAYTDPAEQAYVLEQYGLEKPLDYLWKFR